jgi:hypothetical protein
MSKLNRMDELLTKAITKAVKNFGIICDKTDSEYYKCVCCGDESIRIFSCKKAQCQYNAFDRIIDHAECERNKGKNVLWDFSIDEYNIFYELQEFILLTGDHKKERKYVHFCGNISCNGNCGVLACGCIDTCRGGCLPGYCDSSY